MRLTDVAVAGEPIKQSIMVQRLEINFSEETKEFLLKALQAKPVKHGEWQVDEAECIYGKKYIITCSECGESVSVTETALPYEKYCRNCGAKMDKE